MKKLYTKPEVDITVISSVDVISLLSGVTQKNIKEIAKGGEITQF